MQAVCKQIDRVTRDAAEPNSNIFSFVRLRPILNGTLKFNYIQCRRIGQADAPGPLYLSMIFSENRFPLFRIML
jgi:hypothetical protein